MHHTGLPEGVTPVVPEEPEGEEQQGAVLQEAAQDEDQDADLPECPNHHPSSFEKGKPRSISPTVCKMIYFVSFIIYDALSL